MRVVRPWDVGAVPSGEIPDGSSWFFLCGWGRSGTSPLSRIINGHPDAYCTCEGGAIYSLIGLLSTELVDDGEHGVVTYKRAEAGTTLEAIRAVCEAWRNVSSPGAAVYGGKLANNSLRRHELRRVFPGCKFIWTYREPLDQLSSIMHFAEGDTERSSAGALGFLLALRDMTWRIAYDAGVLRVSFEKMATPVGFREELVRVAEYLGLSCAYEWIEAHEQMAQCPSIGRFEQDEQTRAWVDELLGAGHDVHGIIADIRRAQDWAH